MTFGRIKGKIYKETVSEEDSHIWAQYSDNGRGFFIDFVTQPNNLFHYFHLG